MPITDTARLLIALRFAAERHRGQRRKGADHRPYIEHPIDVATTLATVAGITDVELLSAALLHDVVEDTPTSLNELETRFGRTVRDLVAEVTDDESLPSSEQKRLQVVRAPGLSHGARLIRIADKLCNVRDIVLNPPPSWSLERRRAYFDWTKQVVDAVRGTHAALEQEFDDVQAMACRTVDVLDAIDHRQVP